MNLLCIPFVANSFSVSRKVKDHCVKDGDNSCIVVQLGEFFFLLNLFCFQDIQLVNFGHLLKDGELLIKVSDQPPKKRYNIQCRSYRFNLWTSFI